MKNDKDEMAKPFTWRLVIKEVEVFSLVYVAMYLFLYTMDFLFQGEIDFMEFLRRSILNFPLLGAAGFIYARQKVLKNGPIRTEKEFLRRGFFLYSFAFLIIGILVSF